MFIYSSKDNYDLYPSTIISSCSDDVIIGNNNLEDLIKSQIAKGNKIFILNLYPGVNQKKILSILKRIDNSSIIETEIIETDRFKLDELELKKIFEKNISNDRVFGYMTDSKLEDCFDKFKIEKIQKYIKNTEDKIIFILGVGANIFFKGDIHYYFDITRWEIQLRFRKNISNWLFANANAPILTKYKIGFFVEWRLADANKEKYFNKIDYWVDSNEEDNLKMIGKNLFHTAFEKISREPFRMEPYFDKSVWGGQWMKNMFGLDKKIENFGWSFDGVPEENSVTFKFGESTITFPTINLVKLFPRELLGERVYSKFGSEFPIRFDMLDTFEGGNLSLQVHPTNNYIKSNFGMNYTQDESYYVLDSTQDSFIYIGLKKDVDQLEMIKELEAANNGELIFNVEKYINKIPVKKHDHISIPAGTVHCLGKDTQVLEISSTPYIFTFKLWDWGNIGFDGLPRPVHIDHGQKNIQWERDTDWVTNNLITKNKIIEETDYPLVEETGLHSSIFIETKRYTFFDEIQIDLADSVAVINLVEGEDAYINSVDSSWVSKKIHYGETFIIPAKVGSFIIKSTSKQITKIIVATVR